MKNFGYAILGATCAFLLACSDSDSSGASTEGGEVSITDKTISGVSQKGPFVKGSSVTVYELGAQSLSQTGKSYDGKIKNERGEFTVEVEKLGSPYALLKADGYYRNEITGEKSNGTVTLYAMTDLSNRSEVNVNLLTHLEYERSLYLVKNEKMSVAEAKKQAEKEVLESFGIEGDFENSENLNIFGDDAGSAALLAISVLMQGNLKEADFTERLNDYASDIEDDGKWDDKKTATLIADWAVTQSMSGGLAVIRNNIAGWKLSTGVPAFEKYVDNFWWRNYGLGTCDKEREGEVKKNQNAASVYADKYFICRSNLWYVATTLEYDTYEWKDGKDGDVKNGDVVKENCYVFEDSAWREGNANDCSLGLRGCTKMRQDTVGLGADSVWYICGRKWLKATDIDKDTATWGKGSFGGEIRAGQVNKETYYVYKEGNESWRKATEIEYDTYDYDNNKDWAAGKDGELKNGSVTNSVYVYDSTEWRLADGVEKKLGGCVADNDGAIEKAGQYYKCSQREWVLATELQYDTYKKECTEFGQITHGNVNEKYAYFCYGEEWKRFYGNENIVYEKLIDERDGQIYRTVKIGGQTWMAENLNYADSAKYPSELKVEVLGRLYYGSYPQYRTEYKGVDFADVCPEGWHVPVDSEWVELYSISNTSYALQAKGIKKWEKATDEHGFSALPFSDNQTGYTKPPSGNRAYFWSRWNEDSFWIESDGFFIETSAKCEVCSIRCIKDEDE